MGMPARTDCYQDRPKADWDDVMEATDRDDIQPVFWEAAGPDAFPYNAEGKEQDRQFVSKALEAINIGDDALLGKMFREQIQTYFTKRVQEKLELRAEVQSDLNDMLRAIL